MGRSARPRLRITAGLGVAAVLLAGCATSPPPLPQAAPGELPQAWLKPLAAEPCPGPLKTRVHLRIETPDQPGVNLDGTLKMRPPSSLRLSGRIGVFRPIFDLLANRDSCELLVHEPRRFWITPRGAPEWRSMNPSAWVEVLGWALCPGSLVRRLLPDGPGRVEDRIWRVAGAISETPYRVELRIDPRSRSVTEIRIAGGNGEAVLARLGGYRWFRGAWMPRVLDLFAPGDGGTLHLRADLVGLQAVDPAEVGEPSLVRPPGWAPAGEREPIPFPVPQTAAPGNRLPSSP